MFVSPMAHRSTYSFVARKSQNGDHSLAPPARESLTKRTLSLAPPPPSPRVRTSVRMHIFQFERQARPLVGQGRNTTTTRSITKKQVQSIWSFTDPCDPSRRHLFTLLNMAEAKTLPTVIQADACNIFFFKYDEEYFSKSPQKKRQQTPNKIIGIPAGGMYLFTFSNPRCVRQNQTQQEDTSPPLTPLDAACSHGMQ